MDSVVTFLLPIQLNCFNPEPKCCETAWISRSEVCRWADNSSLKSTIKSKVLDKSVEGLGTGTPLLRRFLLGRISNYDGFFET